MTVLYMRTFIENEFGSKKGLFNFIRYKMFCFFGKYNNAAAVDFLSVKRFVFVCSGNICRSSMAESVIKRLGGNAISFGLDTRGGDSADPRMIVFAKERGFDLSGHVTTPVDQYNQQAGDLLIGMEPAHYLQLNKLYPEIQVTMLGLWLSHKVPYLHDPYSANIKYFYKCADLVVSASEMLFANCAKK